ncbi:MFS transporter [Isoptericola variabilis]|uniref:MFS transporter n=1 Tax=Isoptericola variabilis TaxID=139208 RepID=UPI0021BDC9D0|nr:MFS transporter [Isoptericola variabilis]
MRTTLPWPSLLVLGAATFVTVTAEMLPTAVLPQMSAGLGVPESRTGLLVSAWAAVVVVASFPLVRLVAGRDRRAVIAAALAVLAASSLVTALAPTYEFALAGRTVGAAAVGLLWASANAHTADLVPDAQLGRAVAVVLGGATLGMVLGTPLASLVARAADWRVAFGALAALALAAALAVRLVVAPSPRVPDGATRPDREGPASAPRTAPDAGPGPMLAVTGLVAVLLVGHYGAYTFVTRLVEAPAQALPGGVSGLLLLFGVASAVGVAAAGGRFGSRTRAALVVATVATALALAALAALETAPAFVGVAVVALWGVASGAVPPLAQTLVLRLAGPARRDTAGALIPVLFNGGGVGVLPLPAAALVAATAVGLASGARGRAQQAGATGSPVPVRR